LTDSKSQSTAYLITKVSDPPPPPSQVRDFTSSQVEWRNKHKFINVPLSSIDSFSDEPPAYQVTDPHPQAPPTRQ